MKKITKKLVVGISAIVLFLCMIVGFVFLTQYREILLEQRQKDLELRANQIAILVTRTINKNNIMDNQEALNMLSTVTDTNMWIYSLKTAELTANMKINDEENVKKHIEEDLNKILSPKVKNIISYKYTDEQGENQMTLVTKILINNNVVGVLFLHKDMKDINVKYDTLAETVSLTIVVAMLLSIMLAIIYSYRFTNPIDKMTIAAKSIAKGNYGIKTNIKQEDEIGELAIALDDMSGELEKYITDIKRLEETTKELVANVSHEFKTPLTLIRGNVENLQDGTLEPSPEIYNKIIRNTKLLERLVNEILDLSKYQTGKVVLKKELIDLNGIVVETVNDMREIAEIKGVSIEFTNENTSAFPLELDYLKLKQVLNIFIDNAIKYSGESKIVKIKLEEKCIEIEDKGLGMTSEQVEHIYERFYQADNQKQGNGLGMCIAKYIIDLHEFDVKIESELNEGTKITLKI